MFRKADLSRERCGHEEQPGLMAILNARVLMLRERYEDSQVTSWLSAWCRAASHIYVEGGRRENIGVQTKDVRKTIDVAVNVGQARGRAWL
jgi:hypothetical protein